MYKRQTHRISRTQVFANPTYASKYMFISSEAVQYESPYWANQALHELDSATSTCSRSIATIKRLSYSAPSQVDSRAMLVVNKTKNKSQYLIATFQVKGDILVGTYVLSSLALNNMDVTRWLKISQKIGLRL